MNLADHVSQQARIQPSGLAAISGSRVLTFQALDLLVWRLAAWLRQEGVAPGDVVGLSFADEIRHLVASLALIRMGAVQLPLPWTEPPQMRKASARRAGVSLVLGDRTEIALDCPLLVPDFTRLAANRSSVDERVRSGDLSSTFLLSLGSGTTGRPKMMELTGDRHFKQGRTELGMLSVRPGERLVFPTALSFMSVTKRRLSWLWRGGANVFVPPGQDWVEACWSSQVQHLRLAASQAARRLERRRVTWSGARLPRLKTLCLGSSTVSEALRRAARACLTENVVVTYATSETGVVAAATAEMQARHPGAVGKPAEDVRIEVVDADGRALPPGEVGEIRIRSPGMIAGYQDDPEATAAVFRDGWFYPRDLGAFTDDGVLMFHGRADDMMILDGINIFPREIELTLESHPLVREAVAFPVPHPVHKDLPAALVVLSGASSEAELIAFCRERIGVRAPCRVAILPEIPEKFRGKVMRRDFFPLLREAGL